MKTDFVGILSGQKNEDYHGGLGLSSTGVIQFIKSPAHYLAYKNQPSEPTVAMEFGSGFHALIGEPELFAKQYVKAPEGIDRRFKEGKDAYAKFLADNQDKKILSHEEYAHFDGMLKAILSNKIALNLLTGGQAEQSFYWKDKATGLLCKCRPDYLRNDGIIVDLKTAKDASLRGFQKSMVDRGYHIQSAWYLDGVSQILDEPLNTFVHIVIEKTPPYAISIYTIDDASLEVARTQIKNALEKFVECQKTNNWPAYPEKIEDVGLPAWAW